MKKVLIIGPLFYNYCKSIGNAFEKLNIEVSILEWTENSIDNIQEKFQYHLQKNKDLFFEGKKKIFNEKIKTSFISFKPELIFVVRGTILDRNTLHFLKESGSLIFLWMMDSIYLTGDTLKNVRYYDHIFLFEKNEVEKLQEEFSVKSSFLPLALDEHVYFPINNKKKSIDILFVGALYPDRIAILKKIIDFFPGKNIKIYGTYFSKLRDIKRFLFRRDKQYFTNKTVQPQILNELYSKSKICINIHHSQSVYGVNQRFFELIGSKTLQITDKRTFIVDEFRNNEIIIYDNPDELIELLKINLKDNHDHTIIIDKAYEKVIAEHTFGARVREIIKFIQ